MGHLKKSTLFESESRYFNKQAGKRKKRENYKKRKMRVL
jgi:hypothetical protein